MKIISQLILSKTDNLLLTERNTCLIFCIYILLFGYAGCPNECQWPNLMIAGVLYIGELPIRTRTTKRPCFIVNVRLIKAEMNVHVLFILP